MVMIKGNGIRISAAFLIIHEDKILLGQRGKQPDLGRWICPGGGIDYGEFYEAAAKREAREELGLDIELLRLAGKGVYEIIDGNGHRIILYSIARPLSFDMDVASDLLAARYFSKDELADLDISPIVREVLRDENWLA